MRKVRRLVGSTLIAAAVAIGVLGLRPISGGPAQAEAMFRAEETRQATLDRDELRAIERRALAAADLRPLNAAIASHVDRVTMVDLLDTEDWWRPYREDFTIVRVVVGDTTLVTRGPAAAGPEAELLKNARRQALGSAEIAIGADTYLLGAARISAAAEGDAVVILGRRIARPATVAAPAPQTPAQSPLQLPWAIAGGVALVGVGLMFSGRRAAPAARLAAPDAAVVADDLPHETTLKFGQRREEALADLLPTNATHAAPAAATAAAPMIVIAEPTPHAPTVFGRYRLVKRLGEGGMSELFIAQTTGVEGFTRSFVLKRLRPELARDKDAVAQFIDEARLQAELVHSNIVPVFDFGVVGGEYFMTQEYIEGLDLGRLMERLATRGRVGLPSPIAYYAAHETLQALAYAHARQDQAGTPLGLVHRDIAAGNVLVSAAGEVKLTDFGIVKSNDRVSRTQIGVVKGNANFMSPEQARGQAVDARSDLFSLGLVLHYCLAGELLYRGDHDLEVLHHAASGLLLEDLQRIERLPDPAPQILGRALALDPGDRFQTAAEFADTLAVHMGGGRIAAARLMREVATAGAETR